MGSIGVLLFYGLISLLRSETVSHGKPLWGTAKLMIGMWIILHFLVVGVLANVIHWDLFGIMPALTPRSDNMTTDSVRSMLVFGLVALGVTATSTLLVGPFVPAFKGSAKTQQREQDPLRMYSILQAIFAALSVLSSVLTIIAFYLEYFRQ